MQLGMILEQYSEAVILAVSEPLTGIQTTCKWPPRISEVKDRCNEEVERIDLRARSRNFRLNSHREPRPRVDNFANLFVPADVEGYQAMVEWSQTADPRCWRWDTERKGIWVTLDAYQEHRKTGKFKRLTARDLLAMYGGDDRSTVSGDRSTVSGAEIADRYTVSGEETEALPF